MSEYTIIQQIENEGYETFTGDLSFIKGYLSSFYYMIKHKLIDSINIIAWIVLDDDNNIASPDLFIDIMPATSYLHIIETFIGIIYFSIIDNYDKYDNYDKNVYIEHELNRYELSRKDIENILEYISHYYFENEYIYHMGIFSTAINKYIYCMINNLILRKKLKKIKALYKRYKDEYDLENINDEKYLIDIGDIFDDDFEKNIDNHILHIDNISVFEELDRYYVDDYNDYKGFVSDKIEIYKTEHPNVSHSKVIKTLEFLWNTRDV